MKDWIEISIGDLGEVITGNTPPTTNRAFYGGPYPFIKPTDMEKDSRYVRNWEETYSELAFKRYESAYIPKGAVGVVTIGTIGEKIFQADRPCFTNQSVNVVIPNKYYDHNFVYYLLKYNLFKVRNANPGTASGRDHVSKSNFCSIKITVPSDKAIQKIIGEILSVYDDLIENNNNRISILEQMAEQIYKEWFVRMRFPGNENAEFEKGVPKGWEVSKISDRFDVYLGGTPSREKPEYWDGDIPWINSGKVNEKRIINESEMITELGLRKSATKVLPKNTTVLAITGATLGQVSILGIPCSTNQSVVGIKDKSGILDEYLFYTIHQNIENLVSYAGGGAQQHINKQIVEDLKILIPEKHLILNFKNTIEPIFQIITNLMFTNKNLKQTRDLLLPRLISGKLRVKD